VKEIKDLEKKGQYESPRYMELLMPDFYSTQVKSGSFLLCPNGSHMAMRDDQKAYVSGLVRWLKAVDEGKTSVTF
jgi:hypothetical protein